MKKVFAMILALAMVFALVGCGNKAEENTAPESSVVAETSTEESSAEEVIEDVEGEMGEFVVLDYAGYVAAELDSAVTIMANVQSVAYNAEYGNVTLFLADEDGAYYVYRATCDDATAAMLTIGSGVIVTGTKSEWSGEVEIVDAMIMPIGGDEFIATATDVTTILASDELAEKINQLVSVSGATVVAYNEAGDAFSYSWDGSGAEGSNSDLYFNVEVAGNTYTFTVESDENAEGSDVYTAVTDLQVGDVIDLQGFLYWYEGAQLHVCDVTPAAAPMTYAEYVAAEVDDAVCVIANVQSAAYNAEYGNVTLFLADEDGAYYVYRATCDDALAAQLTVGAAVKVTGFKSEWSGEVEIVEAVVTPVDGDEYVATATDVTSILAEAELAEKMNQLVAVNGATVVAYNEAGDAFSYSWDGSGAAGSNNDLYFSVEVDGNTYTFTVESDENAEGTEVYTAVTELQVGDVIDLEGFLYWYEGAQLHVSAVK